MLELQQQGMVETLWELTQQKALIGMGTVIQISTQKELNLDKY